MPDPELVQWATDAKLFIIESGEDIPPDDMLMRAAVTFGFLNRRGMIAEVRKDPLLKPRAFDDFDRAHAIALIACGFVDHPPSTPERAELFAAELTPRRR